MARIERIPDGEANHEYARLDTNFRTGERTMDDADSTDRSVLRRLQHDHSCPLVSISG